VRERRLTLATFDLWDPIPFFAELGLWAIQGPARRRKARAPLAGYVDDLAPGRIVS